MYSVGDKVAHPVHGAATVSDIVEQKMDGKALKFYVLQLYNSSMTVMLPVEGGASAKIRPVIDCGQADRLIQAISIMHTEQSKNWGKRFRENAEKMKSGDLEQVAEVVKCLTEREKEHGISAGEKTMLNSARKKIIAELMIAKSCGYSEAESMLDDAVCHCT